MTNRCFCKYAVYPLSIFASAWIGLMGIGCTITLPRVSSWITPEWVMDYESAERKVRETGSPLLIFYKSGRENEDQRIRAALDSPEFKTRIESSVRCILFRSYEPDRRYVAQFGVRRAPALILVHPDGTYHATVGSMLQDQIGPFLAESKPPGARPNFDPFLSRKSEYLWHESLESATLRARQTGRPLFIIYERNLSNDGIKLQKLLIRREVYYRLAPMIHVRIAVPGLFTKTCITPFGTLQLPAVVIAHPGGSFFTLELPTNYESVVRFADRSLAALAKSHSRTETVSSGMDP